MAEGSAEQQVKGQDIRIEKRMRHPDCRLLPFSFFAAVALFAPCAVAQTVAAARALPMCPANQVSLGTDDENGNFNGMSHSGTLLVLRNLGSTPCRVDATPQVTFADAMHDLAAKGEMQGARFMHPGPVMLPVVIAPGAEVTSNLRWVSGEVYDKNVCIAPSKLTLKIGTGSQTAAFGGHLCGDGAKGGVTYEMTRFAPDPVYNPAAKPITR